MKRLTLIFTLLLLLSSPCHAAGPMMAVVGAGGTAAASCTTSVFSQTGAKADSCLLGYSTTRVSCGQQALTIPVGGACICSVKWYMAQSPGGVTAAWNYFSQFWTYDGTNLTAQQGASSATVAGNLIPTSGNDGWVTFTWSPCLSLAAGTYVPIVTTDHAISDVNYITAGEGPNTDSGIYTTMYDASGVRQSYSAADPMIQVFK